MEIAFHLDVPDTTYLTDHFPKQLHRLYADCFDNNTILEKVTRIYIGDEFCVNKVPTSDEFEQFIQWSQENGLSLTLLLPALTDPEIKRLNRLFQTINSIVPKDFELVVNDWGLILFLRKFYPDISVSAGRLFNKGFKDPRLSIDHRQLKSDPKNENLLSTCSIDFQTIIQQFTAFGIYRIERDILPYENMNWNIPDDRMQYSIYFPYGYITTGRACWTAAVHLKTKHRFVPGIDCPRFCKSLFWELKNISFKFRIFVKGNTVYYLYPANLVYHLIEQAIAYPYRLVYQGLTIGGL